MAFVFFIKLLYVSEALKLKDSFEKSESCSNLLLVVLLLTLAHVRNFCCFSCSCCFSSSSKLLLFFALAHPSCSSTFKSPRLKYNTFQLLNLLVFPDMVTCSATKGSTSLLIGRPDSLKRM